jgi:hypothetical protein
MKAKFRQLLTILMYYFRNKWRLNSILLGYKTTLNFQKKLSDEYDKY